MYYLFSMNNDSQKNAVDPELRSVLERIADALDRLTPPPAGIQDLARLMDQADAFVWQAEEGTPRAIERVSYIELGLLRGIDQQIDILLANTRHFAEGFPANNALLWGARGTGKSSIVKAVHGEINRLNPGALVLIEIHREDISSLPGLLTILRACNRQCLVFCDDLSFDGNDGSYKSLKAVLEGGLEGRPDNVVFYATSNRRHLMPRDMIENERSTAINPAEAVEEKVSLSDRFGLWLGFHNCDQETYFEIIESYAQRLGLDVSAEQLRVEAKEWTMTRGARSGRVAWQYIQDLAGRLGKKIDFDDGQ